MMHLIKPSLWKFQKDEHSENEGRKYVLISGVDHVGSFWPYWTLYLTRDPKKTNDNGADHLKWGEYVQTHEQLLRLNILKRNHGNRAVLSPRVNWLASSSLQGPASCVTPSWLTMINFPIPFEISRIVVKAEVTNIIPPESAFIRQLWCDSSKNALYSLLRWWRHLLACTLRQRE